MKTAIIDGLQCIGCSLCIPACPIDAILGARQQLHTVLLDECIGCNLCVDVCPVDCISMRPLADMLPANSNIDKTKRAVQAKQRYKARKLRLSQQNQLQLPKFANTMERSEKIKLEIAAALARVALHP